MKTKSVNQKKILDYLSRGYVGRMIRPVFTSPRAAVVKGDHGFNVRIRHVMKLTRRGLVIHRKRGFTISQKGRAYYVNRCA